MSPIIIHFVVLLSSGGREIALDLPLGRSISMWEIIKLAFFVEGQEEQNKGELKVV